MVWKKKFLRKDSAFFYIRKSGTEFEKERVGHKCRKSEMNSPIYINLKYLN